MGIIKKIMAGIIILALVAVVITALVILTWVTPKIPLDHDGRTTCFECHETGISDAPQFPSSHLDKIENDELTDNIEDCLDCHEFEKL